MESPVLFTPPLMATSAITTDILVCCGLISVAMGLVPMGEGQSQNGIPFFDFSPLDGDKRHRGGYFGVLWPNICRNGACPHG